MLTTRLAMPWATKLFVGGDDERNFAAGADEDDVGLAAGGVGEDVGAFGQAAGGGVLGAVERRQVLAGEDQATGRSLIGIMMRQASATSLASAGRMHDRCAGSRAGGQVFDRLVRRAVFADADGVVREDVDRPASGHDRGKTDRGLAVIGEDEERRSRRGGLCDSAMPLRAAAMPCSRMPKWKLRPRVVAGLEIAGFAEVEERLGRRGQGRPSRRSARGRLGRRR